MRPFHKPVQADSYGRINLGKDYAGFLFKISQENEKIVLEPARIIPERELRQRKEENRIALGEREWAKFEEIMETAEDPAENLRKLMNEND